MTALVYTPGSPLHALERACRKIAVSTAPVLISGETGTGKELFAQLIHEASPRTGSLVTINCAAIPEALLESELFGYKRGAFTDARHDKPGRILAAHSGTLFLDEIGELPSSIQGKLLRLLQEWTYEPVGACKTAKIDARLVAATNRDLAIEVAAGRFRRDLYYRLLVCPVEVPPLRDRRVDIAALFRHFWKAHGETRSITDDALRVLEEYDWPGNVRELENLAERLSITCESAEIGACDLPAHFQRDEPVAIGPEIVIDRSVDLPALLTGLEDAYIDAALAKTEGNRKAAADLLGIKRTCLVEKLKRRKKTAPLPEGP